MAVIDKAVKTHGRLDVIWANAGVSGGLVPLGEQTVEQWQEVLRINLIGPFLAVKHAMPHMVKQQSGAIVLTASVAGLKAGASGHPYAASKAGVISLVQTTAYSLTGTGVRINAVCPGLIETGMTKPIFDRAKERGTADKIGQLNPLEAPRPAARARGDGIVPGQRRSVVCQRPGVPGGRRPDRVDAVYGEAGLASALVSRTRCVRDTLWKFWCAAASKSSLRAQRSNPEMYLAESILDCFAALAMTVQDALAPLLQLAALSKHRHTFASSRPISPELCFIASPPIERGRREDREPAGTHCPLCQTGCATRGCTAGIQVKPEHPGLPCAVV